MEGGTKEHGGPEHKDKSGMKGRATTADIICTVIGCFCLHQMGPGNEWIGNKKRYKDAAALFTRQTTDKRFHWVPSSFFFFFFFFFFPPLLYLIFNRRGSYKHTAAGRAMLFCSLKFWGGSFECRNYSRNFCEYFNATFELFDII